MTVSTGNFAELLWPGIQVIWGNNYNQWTPLWSRAFDVRESDKAFEKEQGVTGMPLAAIKDQGSPIPYVDPYQGFQKEYVNVTYALGGSVTREMYEDDQYNYINSIPEMLARSMRQTEETVSFAVLNNGFSSSFTGADGKPLFDLTHPLVAGGTYKNRPTTASDLTQTALEQAQIDSLDLVDDQGLKINVQNKMLMVPTALKFTAEKILGTEYEVDTANNTINPVRGSLELLVSPYLTDTDAWFIKTDVPNGLRFYNRRAAEIERDNEFSTQNLLFITTRRFSVGFTDPKGVYGSPGA